MHRKSKIDRNLNGSPPDRENPQQIGIKHTESSVFVVDLVIYMTQRVSIHYQYHSLFKCLIDMASIHCEVTNKNTCFDKSK